jgi:energy-coupling factor transporter ATP-binding protein EcfA2
MARLTKSEIERRLLDGKSVEWKEANNKSAFIILDSAKQRRLLVFLLGSKIRDVKGLPQDFVTGIAGAYAGAGDPASVTNQTNVNPATSAPWKIKSVKIEGFGGVNYPGGPPFELNFDGESLLIEGPNGSGKSSLTAAIIWALTGERPRDQGEITPDEVRPVFGSDDKPVGDWSPLATYPLTAAGLTQKPNVRVEVMFTTSSGATASAVRTYDGTQSKPLIDPALQIPPILLEAGLLMPSRLPRLRLDEGKGQLTDAVQKLTGLDDLIELGAFVQNLCHATREYRAYKTNELKLAASQFEQHVERARSALAPISIAVPVFKPSDTDAKDGAFALLGKKLNDDAAELTKVVSDDLASGLDLSSPEIQKQIGAALVGAEEDVVLGLGGLATWKLLCTIRDTLDAAKRQQLRDAVASAQQALATARAFHDKEQADTRYRLKAAGAHWHQEHSSGALESCPLCQISMDENPTLRAELEELRTAGEAATRSLRDNVSAIMMLLEHAVPILLRRYLSDSVTTEPRASLLADFQQKFVSADRYSKYLVKCGALCAASCTGAPSVELQKAAAAATPSPEIAPVVQRMALIEALYLLADWFEGEEASWTAWWAGVGQTSASATPDAPEALTAHLARLSKSLSTAEPYRIGAEAMRSAWTQGKTAAAIEKEQAQRKEITDALEPLKKLGNLAEAEARRAIDELSGQIGTIHSATYLADELKFQSASLEKKAGLIVRGKLANDVRIDATLVANTSWLRGILWAFIFALRQEAVEQMGSDMFPILLLDDPQQTFDSEHRHRWAEQIAKMQSAGGVQIILTTHEELFLSFLGIDGVTGRRAMISSAGPELGHVGIFDGDELDRRWVEVQKVKTSVAARDYMKAMREYIEGMLRIMLRGVDPNVSQFVVGDSRNKLTELNSGNIAPWNQSAFASLAGLLGKGVKEIKYIETAHHASGANLGLTEAVDVEKCWHKQLRGALERAFRIAREHRALHGGLTALHALPATVVLPEGLKDKVRTIQLPLLGKAAALSNGRAADGCVELNFDTGKLPIVELGDHVVFRLTTPTLEPVARAGDILLVSEHAKVTPKSLVVALSEDRLLARRLQIAENHSDVAVLTADAINPRMIAPPIVAKFSTLTLRKVVGVIYDSAKWNKPTGDAMEIAECGGESRLTSAMAGTKGLVEVDGYSAEPYALDEQFLIIGDETTYQQSGALLEGKPVIAEDSKNGRYFKRLRSGNGNIILESLEIGGNFEPIVLALDAADGTHLTRLWPVLGVLFEKPK